MAVRSRLLLATRVIPGSQNALLYTVPAGRTAVVRHWGVVNRTAGALEVRAFVRSGGVDTTIATVLQLAAGATFGEPRANLVLGPGDGFAVWHGGASTLTALHATLMGSLLLGEPQ